MAAFDAAISSALKIDFPSIILLWQRFFPTFMKVVLTNSGSFKSEPTGHDSYDAVNVDGWNACYSIIYESLEIHSIHIQKFYSTINENYWTSLACKIP